MTITRSPISDQLDGPAPDPVPRLQNGDVLTRVEFERRYHAMPEVKKAELIEGVVQMPSPVRMEEHAEPHADVMLWLGQYRLATPGVRAGDNGSVRLDGENMPQPDAVLFIQPDRGGSIRIAADGYIEGPPELVVEVAASSASYDLHSKLRAYCRNGVREYVVWRVLDGAIDWFILREGRYDRLEPDAEGILKSEVFPGLWLDAGAMLALRLPRVADVLQQGIASDEPAFVARLAQKASEA